MYNDEKLMELIKSDDFLNVMKKAVPATGSLTLPFRIYGGKVLEKLDNTFTLVRRSEESVAVPNLPKQANPIVLFKQHYVGLYGLLLKCFNAKPEQIDQGTLTFHIELCGGLVCAAWWELEHNVWRN